MTDSATWHCSWHLSATDAVPEAATKRQKSTSSKLATATLQSTRTASEGEENVGEKGSDASGWGEVMEAEHRQGILDHVRTIMESSGERKGGRRVTIVINLFALVHTTLPSQKSFYNQQNPTGGPVIRILVVGIRCLQFGYSETRYPQRVSTDFRSFHRTVGVTIGRAVWNLRSVQC